MKQFLPLLLALLVLVGAACASRNVVCSPESEEPPSVLEASEASSGQIEIHDRMVWMDKIVHGSFCEDSWSGTVYVACDATVAEWKEKPTFLDGCSLTIEEGTVVYVAYHNNEAYYKGCSCHYSETAHTP